MPKLLEQKQWDKIYLFLKDFSGIYCGSERKCRLFIEAVIWILRTGSQWRYLPEDYGYWNSVYKRFSRWDNRGVWDALFTSVQTPELDSGMVDSTVIRAHACSAGYKKRQRD